MQRDTRPGELGFPAKPVLAAIAAASGSTAALCTDVLGAPALQSVTAVCDLHHVRDLSLLMAAAALAGLLVLGRRRISALCGRGTKGPRSDLTSEPLTLPRSGA